LYAQMSGSGSAIFGLFEQCPKEVEHQFKDHFVYITQL
ncbi:MAG: 4-(cytidine 5'-diphospho)-2-C-methyl-D-erythritol kinase, partial [Prevotella sp.]